MYRHPESKVELMTLEAALPPGTKKAESDLVLSWISKGAQVAVYIPVVKIPRKWKAEVTELSSPKLDNLAYLKRSLEARDALYKAMRQKSWPVKEHLLLAVWGNEGPYEFADLYHARTGRFVPSYLIGMVDKRDA